jgi:hypothetical protein
MQVLKVCDLKLCRKAGPDFAGKTKFVIVKVLFFLIKV